MKLAGLRFLLRLVALAASVATAVAIVIARANPAGPVRRIESPPPFQAIPTLLTQSDGAELRRLDFATGRIESFSLPPSQRLSWSCVSPWEVNGRRHLVGIGWDRSELGQVERTNEIGIVRLSLPGGEVLNRVLDLDAAVPSSSPCWIPGVPAGVVYSGGDRRLYRLDFEVSGVDGGVEDVSEPRPRQMNWQVPEFEADCVMILDVVWPDDPRLGGKLLTAMMRKDLTSGHYGSVQLWWLQPDRKGTSIVAAGKLFEAASGDEEIYQRLPTLVSGVGGPPSLAYLEKHESQT